MCDKIAWSMTESDDTQLDEASERAGAMLDACDGDFAALPRPVAYFLHVYCAQGVLDNGGYRYFFEEDWVGQPPYQEFVDAFDAIGCHAQAADLARVAATFPFEEPHRDAAARNRFIREHSEGASTTVTPWGEALCGDEEVWRRLASYSRQHASLFKERDPK